MTRGRISAIVLFATVSLSFAVSVGRKRADEIRNRSRSPSEIQLLPIDSLLRVAWVIRDRDCATCASPAYIWRRAKALYGDTLKLVALVIGSDTQAVRAVLRDERIAASIVILGMDNRMDLVSPSMLLLKGRTIKRRWTQRTAPNFVRLVSDDSGSDLLDAQREEINHRR
jgi:hypothetical protein